MASKTRSCPCRCQDKAPDQWWRASAQGTKSRRSQQVVGDTRPTPISRRYRTGSCTPFAPLPDPSSWVCRSHSNPVRCHPPESWRRRYPLARPPSPLLPLTRATGRPGSARPPTTSPATSPSSAVHRSPGAGKQKYVVNIV